MRTLEYWDTEYNQWFDIAWDTVASGQRVRCFEGDGTPVPDGTGIYEWEVVKDAYQVTISGVGDVWHIDIADPDPSPVPKRAE
jgi:hypothetical protein